MNPTVAVYIRVSSKSQDYSSQWDAIQRALPNGVEPVVYQEKISGKTNERPELKRLLADIRGGQLTSLYVFRLDRLARSGVAGTFKVIGELRASGVTLHSVADNVHVRPDREDIASECLIFALSLAAQIELAAKNDRIAAARVRTEALGLPWGRPSKVSAEAKARMLAMKLEGRSVREISEALKVKRSTVGRIVKAA